MTTELKKIVFVIALILCAVSLVYADWDPPDGHKMHFPQMPNPIGWDIDLRNYELADDWQCSQTGEVSDIHFWISWAQDQIGTLSQITVKIYSNDPNPPFSKPVTQLWSRTFTPGQFTIRGPYYGDQGYWIPNPTSPTIVPHDHQKYYQVNIKDINTPFIQQAGQIYWLSLKVPSGMTYYPGWKTSLDHFMDAAVVKYTPPPGGTWQPLYEPCQPGVPIDFSFVITGPTPEPNVKWCQEPDLTNNGLDVMASQPLILADDFLCTKTTKITDITVWGSWMYDIFPPGGPNNVAFALSIHSDIPGDPNNYSRPGPTLWHNFFMPGTFETSVEQEGLYEGWYDPYYYEYIPYGDYTCFKYVFHIPEANAFCQQGEPNWPIIYWLDVQAYPNDPNGYAWFGWKTSYKHWNDDAVYSRGSEPNVAWWNELRYPYDHPYYPNSIDLAFAIDGNIPCANEPPEPEVKWRQRPDLSENGLDVMASVPLTLADDFECNKSTLITDITIWGSWLKDFLPPGGPNNVWFTLSIHSDIPASESQTGYSIPGEILWLRNMLPSEVSIEREDINEGWFDPVVPIYDPNGDHVCWKYVFHIPEANAFCQQGEPNSPLVYWLNVQAYFDFNDSNNLAPFGWKTSTDHWNDDAVWTPDINGLDPNTIWWELRYPSGHPLYPQSIDLAFAIDGNIPCGGEPNISEKWLQEPDLTTNGIDVMASDPLILADDFLCTKSTLITDITVWGSWKGDILPPGGPNGAGFTLSIHSDIPDPDPCDPYNYSMPGPTVWYKVFPPGTFDVYPTGTSAVSPPHQPAGQIIYVDASATGANNGSSWADAYKYLQDALTAAGSNTEIWVAQGAYRPDENSSNPTGTGDRTATFQLINGVAIYGGFPSGGGQWTSRNPNIYTTILSGDLSGDDVYVSDPANLLTEPTRAENSYNVVNGSNTDATAILDGFTITAGNANSGGWPNNYGGGMFNSYASCTVNNCIFLENSAGGLGGAIFNDHSNLNVNNCIFFRNAGSDGGGGIANVNVSSPAVVSCSFISNKGFGAGNNAGAIYNISQSNPQVVNCLFSNNSAQYGGAISNIHSSSPIIINCTFSNNLATTWCGGINDYNNCQPTIANCILWGNTASQISDSGGSAATVNYSDVQGGWGGAGVGNINANPLFIDADGPDNIVGTLDDNLRLSAGSPCIDAADNTAVPPGITTDLDGHPRFKDDPLTIDTGNGTPPIVDMGSYEYPPNIIEGWWNPSSSEYLFPGDYTCWKYVFHIPQAEAFCQQGEPNMPVVYWLDVQAYPNDVNTQFGWKSSINHWNDDAVFFVGSEPNIPWWDELRYPSGHPLHPQSIDLAFAIDGNIPCTPPENDLGDAPDSSNNFGIAMTTYPSGIVANFPTVYLDPTGLPPFGPIHRQPKVVAWLGPNVTLENEADIGPDQDLTNNIIPLTNTPDQDVNDDGVLNMPLTLFHCCNTTSTYLVNVVNPAVNLYVNIWFDWNRDGDWDDILTCGPNSTPEWAVQNQLLPAGSLAAGLNTITTPQFRPWHPFSTQKEIWMRITLSEQPWVSGGGYVGDGGSGPANGYLYGETEDYYFTPITDCFQDTNAVPYAQWVLQGKPFAWCCPWQNRGDATGDGLVGLADLVLLKGCYGTAYPNPKYNCKADFTHDGAVGLADLVRLKSNYGVNFGSVCRDDWKNDCGPNP